MQLINFPFSGPEAYTNSLLHWCAIQFAFCQSSKKQTSLYNQNLNCNFLVHFILSLYMQHVCAASRLLCSLGIYQRYE